MTKSNIAEAVPAQEPWLNKAAATKILDLALELEKTGRLVSLMSNKVGDRQERTYFVSRNRNVECALRDTLAILVEQSSISQPVHRAAPAELCDAQIAELSTFVYVYNKGTDVQFARAILAAAQPPQQSAQPAELTASEASHKRMFEAACIDLGLISDALGLDPDDGGAAPILEAIKVLKAGADRGEKHAKSVMSDHGNMFVG